ncbi:hypothetical protein HDV01_004308 [Terramyces sp. JEL0728]|nr:hypothetical protein HDV01_004308 [Terramyces sp. JEL0728]
MKQPLPIGLALVVLVLDYISLFMIICVAIGLYRAAKLEAFHTMQYSAGLQMICVALLCIYDILSKHELIPQNWQTGYLYFDGPNIANSSTVWIQYVTASLFHLICVPIYISGLLQVLALDCILSTKNSWLKRSSKSYKRIKLNFLPMMSSAKEQGIPGHVIFQVLHIGYAMPIVGGVKSFELLIWIFPSLINIYYGTDVLIKGKENKQQMPYQKVPMLFVEATLAIDYIGMFLNICLTIGLTRAYYAGRFQIMQYSSILQIFCTIGFSIYSIIGKHELIASNSSFLFFDQADLANSNNSTVHYICATILILICMPIYAAGLLQVLVVDAILKDRNTFVRKTLFESPIFFFSLGIIPGIFSVVCYYIELLLRPDMPVFSINGCIIAPHNLSVVLIANYIISLLLTVWACYGSVSCYRSLQINHSRMLASASTSGIPGYVVFQVLQLGYTLPLVGLVKGLELAIWIFPSAVNVYYGTFGVVILATIPFLTFFNNGSHKGIYPYVPIFNGVLEKVYLKASKEAAWNPFYHSNGTPVGATPLSSLSHGTLKSDIPNVFAKVETPQVDF